jgi:hypothetical protein
MDKTFVFHTKLSDPIIRPEILSFRSHNLFLVGLRRHYFSILLVSCLHFCLDKFVLADFIMTAS